MPISHVESTAIPCMYGINIIDILIGVNNEGDMDMYSNVLIGLGYFPGENSQGNYRFFASSKEETKMGDIHIHLVYINTDRYREFAILIEYLLINKDERKAYSLFKRKIFGNGILNRDEYKKDKSRYVSELLCRAKEFMNN